MLIELLQRTDDALLPDVHDVRALLREVVQRLGERALRLGRR